MIDKGNETVLVVDDEPTVLKMTTTMLERLGYSVLIASMPAEAIRLTEKHGKEIDLLLTDIIMPEMNGRDLAERLLSNQPGMRCLYMSGYTANIISKKGELDDGVFFIQKPFTQKELAAKIREVLDGGLRK